MRFEGIYVVTPTPMHADESVDFDTVRKHMRFLVENGVHGIIPCGSTGEGALLTIDEKKQVLETVLAEVNGRVPVLGSPGMPSTRDALDLCQHAERAGAQGVMMIPPYYHVPTHEEVLTHFRTIADAVDFDIMVYNQAVSTFIDLSPEELVSLNASHPNISHVKESIRSDVARTQQIVRLSEGRMIVHSGLDEIVFEQICAGARGWVSATAGALPSECVEFWNLLESQEWLKARDLYYDMIDLMAMVDGRGKLPQYIKACLDHIGIPFGPPRRPLLPASETERQELASLLAKARGSRELKAA